MFLRFSACLLPLKGEGWIPPSLPSQQLPSGHGWWEFPAEEEATLNKQNMDGCASLTLCASQSPFLRLLLPGSVLLSLPFSPPLSRGAAGDRERWDKDGWK